MNVVTGSDDARRLALALCAFVWFYFGTGVLLSAGQEADPAIPFQSLPLPTRVGTWYVPAVLALSTLRTRDHADLTVFCLILAPAIRFGSHLYSWWLWVWPAGQSGYGDGWFRALGYVSLIGLVILTAILTRTDRSVLPSPGSSNGDGRPKP